MKKICVALIIFAGTLALVANAQSVSPDGSSITPTSGGSLVTSDGTWTFSTQVIDGNNVILLNGQSTDGWGIKLVAYGGNMYQLNSANIWYVWQNGGWPQTSDPTPTGSSSSGGGSGTSSTNPCTNYYTSSVTVPTGYGAAYDLFSTQHELEVNVNCSGSNPVLTVGSNQSNQYVYNKGYVYQSGSWQSITLTGAVVSGSTAWDTARSTASLAGVSASSWTYVVGYVCSWSGAVWQCGCATTACTTNYWQLQAFENSSVASSGGVTGGDTSVPAPAAAVGYTYEAMYIENWSPSMIDMQTQGSGFLWYNDYDDNGSGEPGTPNSGLTFANGNLFIAENGIGSAAPDKSGQTPSLNPSAGWVGTVYGPGFYAEATMSTPAPTNIAGALWGNTFYNFFNETNIQGVELDWAEFDPPISCCYNVALHDWVPPSTQVGQGNDESTPLPAGFDFTKPHKYAVLVVPSQDNGGQGYAQAYIDDQPYYKLTWTAGGQWSRLDTTPYGFIIAGDGFTIGKVRIFVKDASKVIHGD
jgi:hypothetical protein